MNVFYDKEYLNIGRIFCVYMCLNNKLYIKVFFIFVFINGFIFIFVVVKE